jgi:Uma2 family endonuclease
MPGVSQCEPPRVTVEQFRAFYETRPDNERWELIDGVVARITPATLPHQRIVGNFQRLLVEALEQHDPTRTALHRIGVNVASAVEYYDSEPDVVVIDSQLSKQPGLRYADRFYLAAEIVSESDRTYVESKRAVYKLHDSCTCILTIQQDRCEVRVDMRTSAGWREDMLMEADDVLALSDFGLRCKVAELYWGTALEQGTAS